MEISRGKFKGSHTCNIAFGIRSRISFEIETSWMCFELLPFSPFFSDLLCFLHFTVNNRQRPTRTGIVDPERGLPLARHHPSSVGLYKYTIVLILYLSHPLRSFCSRGSSFYILAASAKQLMCTECVDSNCLAIVAPSRLALYMLARARARERVAVDHRAVCRPRGALPFDSSYVLR